MQRDTRLVAGERNRIVSSSPDGTFDHHHPPSPTTLTGRLLRMSVWPALQSFGSLLVGWGAPDVGSAWDEEMGSVGGPAGTGSSTGEGNTSPGAVEGDHEVQVAQESPAVAIEGSAVVDGVSAAGVEAAGSGIASNEGADNRLRLRAWGKGCGGCGISLPTTRDGRRALMILGVVLIVLGCLVLGITAEVNRMSGGN
ncbi:hypothetical protein K488DRAFT_84108 [Vararia minispora EC-137]|uniref:Uncharacterized protein n=1 Tax=Vararia minispora EC-137 TaxID=1314806 RepID=A0ACB8QS58_9AGAM|nr:hypothetical protein K488DRAFT_84108 [Vararia minispora EC-137]